MTMVRYDALNQYLNRIKSSIKFFSIYNTIFNFLKKRNNKIMKISIYIHFYVFLCNCVLLSL